MNDKIFLAIQCDDSDGETGSFAFTRKPDGSRNRVSPLFDWCGPVFDWAIENGWQFNGAGYDSAHPVGYFIRG